MAGGSDHMRQPQCPSALSLPQMTPVPPTNNASLLISIYFIELGMPLLEVVERSVAAHLLPSA